MAVPGGKVKQRRASLLLLLFCLLRQILLSTTGPTMVQGSSDRICNLTWLAKLTRDSTIRLMRAIYPFLHFGFLQFIFTFCTGVEIIADFGGFGYKRRRLCLGSVRSSWVQGEQIRKEPYFSHHLHLSYTVRYKYK